MVPLGLPSLANLTIFDLEKITKEAEKVENSRPRRRRNLEKLPLDERGGFAYFYPPKVLRGIGRLAGSERSVREAAAEGERSVRETAA